MTFEERDSLFTTISELSEMNRIMNRQAWTIECRQGYWKEISAEEARKKVDDYDEKMALNAKIINRCIMKLSEEYGWN